MYLVFKRIEEITRIYEETREKADYRFYSAHIEVASLAKMFGTGKNDPSETVKACRQSKDRYLMLHLLK